MADMTPATPHKNSTFAITPGGVPCRPGATPGSAGAMGLYAIRRLNFATAIVADVDLVDRQRRCCFEHAQDAHRAGAAWNGKDHPGGAWIKCKGAGIDLLNPALTCRVRRRHSGAFAPRAQALGDVMSTSAARCAREEGAACQTRPGQARPG